MSMRFDSAAYDMLYPRPKPVPHIESSCEKFEETCATESSDIEVMAEAPEIEEPEGGVSDGLGADC